MDQTTDWGRLSTGRGTGVRIASVGIAILMALTLWPSSATAHDFDPYLYPLTVLVEPNVIHLDWDPIEGTDKYEVHWDFSLAPNSLEYWDGGIIYWDSGTSYDHYGAMHGLWNHYSVYANHHELDLTGSYWELVGWTESVHVFFPTPPRTEVRALNAIFEPGLPYSLKFPDRVSLIWQSPANDGGSPCTEYRVYREPYPCSVPPEDMTYIGSSYFTHFSDKTIEPGMAYTYAVEPVNAYGRSHIYRSVSYDPKPSPPGGLTAVGDPDSITLTFSPPADTGGSSITSYEIMRSTSFLPDESVKLMTPYATAPPTTQYGRVTWVDTGILPGQDYYYWVIALNRAGGVSEPSLPASAQILYDVSFAQSGLGSDAYGTVVTIDSVEKSRSLLPQVYPVQQGSSYWYSYSSVVSSTVEGKRYVLDQVIGPASPFTVSQSVSVIGVYRTEYYLTVDNGGHGTVSGEGWHPSTQFASFSISRITEGVAAWSYPTGGVVGSSPAVANGIVYFGSVDKNVYALDASSGSLLWSHPTGGVVFSSPFVADNVVYIGSCDHNLYALNASTGEEKWVFPTLGIIEYASPVVVDSTVYFGSCDNKMYALNAATGQQLWSHSLGDTIQSRPAVADGRLFIGATDGVMYALDAATGDELWRRGTGVGLPFDIEIWSSPAVVDGIVYFGSDDAMVYALDASTGAILWTFATNSWVESSPAVVDGKVYVGSWDHCVYSLSAQTGSLLWSYETGDYVYSSPCVVENLVYVGSGDGKIYALDSSSGAPIWYYVTGSYVDSSPTLYGGLVYVGSWDKSLYALEGDIHYAFTCWSGDSSSTEETSTILMNGPKTVMANWEIVEQRYLSVSNGGHGTTTGSDWYDTGTSAAFAVDSAMACDAAWIYETGGPVYSSPAVTSLPGVNYGNVVVGSNDGYLYGFGWDGSRKSMANLGGAVYSSPAIGDDGRLYAGSPDHLLEYEGRLTAINPDRSYAWMHWTDGEVYASPTVVGGRVYVGSDDGKVYAIDTAGYSSLAWSYQTYGPVRCSPAVSDGVVYFGSLDNYVYAVSASSGSYLWFYPTGYDVYSSPAVAYGRVFIGSDDGYIYAINLDGTLSWRYLTGGPVRSSPAVANGKVYVGSMDGKVYALNLDGTLAWSFATGGAVRSSPAVVGDVVYVGSYDWRVYALDAAGGSLVWTYKTGGPVYSSPAVVDGRLYIGSLDGKVYALIADVSYLFTGWSGDSSSTQQSSTILMDEPKTVIANWEVWAGQNPVVFDQTGLQSDTSDVVVTINGVPKVLTDLPCTIWVLPGMSLSYSYSPLVSASTVGKRFELHGVDGPTSPMTVTGPVTVTGNYGVQWYLTVTTDFGTVSPESGWYDAFRDVRLSAVPPTAGPGEEYVFNGWSGTGDGSYSGTDNGNNESKATMLGPISESASWSLVYVPPVVPASSFTVAVDAGELWFFGELVEFHTQVSYEGMAVDADSIEATLYGPDTPMSLTPVRIDVGLYEFQLQLPGDGPTGVYSLVVKSTLIVAGNTVNGIALKDVQVGTALAQFDAWLIQMNGDIGTVKTDIGNIKLSLGSIAAKLVSIDGGIATISTTVGTILTNVQNIDTKLTSVQDSVALVSSSLGDLHVDVAAIDAKLVLVQGSTARIESAVGDLDVNVTAINTKLVSIEGRIGLIESSVGTIKMDVSAISGEVTAIEGTMATISSKLNTIQTDVASINATLVSVDQRTATIQTDLGVVKVDVAWIKAAMNQLWGNKLRITTTVGEIIVDASSVDMSYIPWAVEPKERVDPAMYVGMAMLAMSLFAAGVLTRGPSRPGNRSPGRRSQRG